VKCLLCLWLLMACSVIWAAVPDSSTTTATSDQPPVDSIVPADKVPKLQKWSGTLVNAVCMAESLRQIPSISEMLYPEPLLQYYQQGIEGSDHPPQGTGSGAAAGDESHPAGQPRDLNNGEPETSQRELDMQAAELRRVELVKQKVNVCLPNEMTAHFGILVPAGDLLTFDATGDSKARKELKHTSISVGKRVKAKVTGATTKEGEVEVIKVSSIEIKGLAIRPSRALVESGALR